MKIIKTLMLGFAMYLSAATPVFAAQKPLECSAQELLECSDLITKIVVEYLFDHRDLKWIFDLRRVSKAFRDNLSAQDIVEIIRQNPGLMQDWQDSFDTYFDAYIAGGSRHAVSFLYLAAKESRIDVRQALLTPNVASNDTCLHRAADASALSTVKLLLDIAGQEGVKKELCAIPDWRGKTPLQRVLKKPLVFSSLESLRNFYIIVLLFSASPVAGVKDLCSHRGPAQRIFVTTLTLFVFVLFINFFRATDRFILSKAMDNNRGSQCYTIEHLQDLERSIQNYAGSQCFIPEWVTESTRFLLKFLVRRSLI